MSTVTEEQVRNALRQIQDPDLGRDIVALDFVKEIKICDGAVGATIELTTPACPVKEQMKSQAETLIKDLPGVTAVNVKMTAQTVGRNQGSQDVLKGCRNVVAIGSGKGGVGKSTATVNLALALASTGATVGVLDADIYGPSIPGMLGITKRPDADASGRAIPPEAFGVKAMSVGMLVGDDAPTIWRGPIASRLLQQFLGAVNWGELDYLLLDLPPGTGDIQLTLTQSAPLNGAVIVTTPQEVALRIAKKGLKMFEQVKVPITGIIENMSGFVCPKCDTHYDIFSKGGGEKAAREMGVPFLGSVPLDPRMVVAGDMGTPLVAMDKESPGAKAFETIARNLASQLSIQNLNANKANSKPKEVLLVNQERPKIIWNDGTETSFEHRQLRLACPCANCVSETTGERMIKDENVPADIKVVSAQPVGNYGLNIGFSDNHSSGIYTHDVLRKMGSQASLK